MTYEQDNDLMCEHDDVKFNECDDVKFNEHDEFGGCKRAYE